MFQCKKKSQHGLKENLITSKLKVLNLSKKYSKETVVQDFSIEIPNAEIIAIIGQNGAGKSTVLGMIAGFIQATSGLIACNSKRFCPQQNILWDYLTVEEHIKLYASLNQTSDLSSIEKSGLSQQRHVLAKNLSGGMKRRLSLSISIIGEPEILLLDEPTTGLDPIARRQIWKFINLISKNKVIIFTSHSMEETQHLAQNVLVMEHGKTLHYCSLHDLKSIYCKNYEITVVRFERENFLKEFKLKFSEIELEIGKEIRFCVSKEGEKIEEIVGFLEGSASVEKWELSQESLEKVFFSLNS